MDVVIFGVIVLVGGAALAGAIWLVIWKATGNAFDWLIHTFGNERAAAEVERWRKRGRTVTDQRVKLVMGERLRAALAYAAELHEDQSRKGGDIAYIGHLLIVAGTVIEWGGDEDMAIAAVLHDAIEDQSAKNPRPEILRRFGDRVVRFVEGLSDSDVEDKSPWLQRKKDYCEHLRKASDEIVMISLADKLHNARAMLSDYLEVGDELWGRFTIKTQGAMPQLWYLKNLLAIYEGRPFWSRAWEFRATIERLAREAGIAWDEIVEPLDEESD